MALFTRLTTEMKRAVQRERPVEPAPKASRPIFQDWMSGELFVISDDGQRRPLHFVPHGEPRRGVVPARCALRRDD
jgi:hypothetical protein